MRRGPRRCGLERHLVIMVKVPVAGRVKTRLARGIGAVRAAAFYRRAISILASRLATRSWRLVLAVSPDADLGSRLLPAGARRMAQGRGDLGQRMQRVMDRLPPGPAVIIGGDIPGITGTHIRTAFRTLGRADAVLGPSSDGGYWLVGLRRTPRVLRGFDGVRWSSQHALADTKRALGRAKVAEIGMLDDIDEALDLARARACVGRRVLPVPLR